MLLTRHTTDSMARKSCKDDGNNFAAARVIQSNETGTLHSDWRLALNSIYRTAARIHFTDTGALTLYKSSTRVKRAGEGVCAPGK